MGQLIAAKTSSGTIYPMRQYYVAANRARTCCIREIMHASFRTIIFLWDFFFVLYLLSKLFLRTSEAC